MTQRPLVPDEKSTEKIEFTICGRVEGKRIDQYLTNRFPDYTRSFIQSLIKEGQVEINGKKVKASTKIRPGAQVTIYLPPLKELHLEPEEMPLDIIYEDESMIAINKPADLVIHPSRGHLSGTLVNGLLAHFQQLSDINDIFRPGIIHRLDRYTSGIILIAKTNAAHAHLASQFENRTIQKEYLALVEGNVPGNEGLVSLPIDMDPRNRQRMAICSGGKPAETTYQVLARYAGAYTLLHVFPKTGRTHQIRVHTKSQGHPIVADDLYDAKNPLAKEDVLLLLDEERRKEVEKLWPQFFSGVESLMTRQALHAWKITFQHPTQEKTMQLQAPLADDLQQSLKVLEWLWPHEAVDFVS